LNQFLLFFSLHYLAYGHENVLALYESETDLTNESEFDKALETLSDVTRTPRDQTAALAAYQDDSAGDISIQEMSTEIFSASSAWSNQNIHLIFAEYYNGNHNFADDFTLAAIQGTGDFAAWDDASLRELATKGAAYLNTLQYVYGLLQFGISECPSLDAGIYWDKAWAYFAGSAEGEDGSGSGYSAYALADKRCPQFDTCVAGTSLATTNENARASWLAGRAALELGVCDSADASFQNILKQSLIPLIQGSLREAFEVDPAKGAAEADGKIEIAEMWAFVFPLLPLLNECDASVASTIRDNMFINADPILQDGFDSVKTAFESLYSCLGISCADVGAMKTCGSTGNELCWQPCSDIISSSLDDCDDNEGRLRSKLRKLTILTIVGWILFCLVACSLLFLIITQKKNYQHHHSNFQNVDGAKVELVNDMRRSPEEGKENMAV